MSGSFKISLFRSLAAKIGATFCHLLLPSPFYRFSNTSVVTLFSKTSENTEVPKMPGENAKYLKFVKISPNAFSPAKGSEKAAGFDLKSAYNYVIQPHSKEMVKTDLQIMLPDGCYGRVAPRSGLAWKHAIDVFAGVIDEDYRGDVRVILFNHSDEPFTIQPGDRIAQLICERIYYPDLQEVTNLSPTKRGAGGFGSTGQN